jgi:hypothetical protein
MTALLALALPLDVKARAFTASEIRLPLLWIHGASARRNKNGSARTSPRRREQNAAPYPPDCLC